MATKRTHPHPGTRRLALDPYRIEDTTWTREEILRARGEWPTRWEQARQEFRRRTRVAP